MVLSSSDVSIPSSPCTLRNIEDVISLAAANASFSTLFTGDYHAPTNHRTGATSDNPPQGTFTAIGNANFGIGRTGGEINPGLNIPQSCVYHCRLYANRQSSNPSISFYLDPALNGSNSFPDAGNSFVSFGVQNANI